VVGLVVVRLPGVEQVDLPTGQDARRGEDVRLVVAAEPAHGVQLEQLAAEVLVGVGGV